MNSLSTALALLAVLCAIAACVAGLIGYRMIERADELLHDLEGERRKLKVIRDDQVSIHGRIDRLSGRVYSQTRKPPPTPINGGWEEPPADEPLDPELAAELALQRAAAVSPGRK